MKTVCFIIACIIVFSPGIQSMSQKERDEITIPHENFRAVITDIDGVATEGDSITFDDQVVVFAKRGSTTVYIPFERLSSIELIDNENVILKELEEIDMKLVLKDGSEFTTMGRSHHEITGKTQFGRFRIRLDRVRSIEFISTEPANE